MVYQNHKSCSFRVRRGVLQGSVLGPVLFSLFTMIFRPLCLLPSAALFTLTIWPFGPPVPRSPLRCRPHKELFRLERWSEYWCLPLNPRKCEASFFSVDPHQANLQTNLPYSAPASVSIPLQLFLRSPSTALFLFLNMNLR